MQIGAGTTTGSIGSAPITNNGNLVFDRSGTITAANPIAGSGVVRQTGAGTLILSATNSYTGGTSVQGGTLVTATNLSNGTLAISSATARVAQRTANNDPASADHRAGVSITSGTLDLNNNAMIVDYAGASPLLAIRSQLITGYATGNWNGPGIDSTSASNDSSHASALGYGEASTLGITTFAGHTLSDATDVLVRYTLSGDANLDGVVNALDFNALATHFGEPGTTIWTDGDFNYDGQVSTMDFISLSQNFNAILPPPSAPALGTLVPEPIGAFACCAFLPTLIRRRRHRCS